MFQSIKRIIPDSLKQVGLEEKISAALVLDEAKKTLIRLWDEDRASFVEPISFTNGELHVRVTSPSALALLRTEAMPWMNEINRVLGGRKVLRIVSKRQGF